MILIGGVTVATYVGFKAPEIFLANATKKRQAAIRLAWPDALDLLLICVESGMSVEHALKRVSKEMADQSPPLAEELTLTNAELSFLEDRTRAYENFGRRTGLDGVAVLTLAGLGRVRAELGRLDLGLRDVSRSDFIVGGDGSFVVLETAITPGTTETSVFPYACTASGTTLGEVARDLLLRAVRAG